MRAAYFDVIKYFDHLLNIHQCILLGLKTDCNLTTYVYEHSNRL